MGGQFTQLMSTVAPWFFARRGLMSGIVAAGVGGGPLFGPPLANYRKPGLSVNDVFSTPKNIDAGTDFLLFLQ